MVMVSLCAVLLQGKGTEDISRYSDCKLQHLDIPNIHHVRDSYDALLQLALSSNNSKWLSALESTGWLNFISLILKARSTNPSLSALAVIG